MPSISGPSITSSGRVACWRASSVSSTTYWSMPFTSACESRAATGCSRHCRSSTFFSPFFFLKLSAISSSRSVASSRRFSTTSSTRSRSSGSSWSYNGSAPALTMPMSMPALMAWYRNTTWIACRTGSLPRKLKLTLDTPPEIWLYGNSRRSSRAASMKSTA